MAKMYIVARDSLDTTQSYITDLTPYEYRVVDIPIVEYEGTAKDFSWNGPWASDLFLNDIQESAFISLKEGQSIANMTDYWRVNYGGGYTVSYQWYSNGKYVSNTTSVVMSGNWTFQYKPSYSAYSIIGDNTRDGGSHIMRPDHNKDGTYISALYDFVEVGSPTVVHLDLKDWLTGWLYGMVGRRLFIKKKSDEIVAPDTAGMCLYGTPATTTVTYNGVELPDIESVWTDDVRTEYSHAHIVTVDTDYGLIATTFSLFEVNKVIAAKETGQAKIWLFDAETHSWQSDDEEYTYSESQAFAVMEDIVWTSHDILSADGSVSLAATEPVHSGNIGLRNGETVTYYDGAVLPPLPEWDKTKYPYAYVCVNPSADYHHAIYFTNIPVFVCYAMESGKYTHLYQTEIVSYVKYRRPKEFNPDADDVWVYDYAYTDSDGLFDQGFVPIWANVDVERINRWRTNDTYPYTYEYEATGEIAIAASDPIPVSGLVGYSYNGTVLPALPEWDKTVYPYASIWNLGIYNYLWISSQPQYIAAASDGNDAIHSLTPNIGYCYEIDRSEDGWLRLRDDNYGGGQYLKYYDFVWCNAPIEKDGTVVYERTDPIPVYE